MKKSNDLKPSPLREKSFLLAIRIVRLAKYLQEQKREFVMSRQILKAGTNPEAMVREANNAESPMDFIHKLGVAQKEIAETMYWLELLNETDYYNEFESLHNDAKEIMKMIRSSILTKEKNLNS